MKIAVPLADGRLCMHFGHCQQFAMIEVDQAGRKAMATELLTPPPHEPGLLPRWLHEQGVDLVIAGGIGQRAKQLLDQSGVKVLAGAPADPPDRLVSEYLAGNLVTGENACDH